MTSGLPILIEIPKGSRNTYEWDEKLQAIKLDRFLFASVVYPSDYGFVPETLADDGDPLDAIVCVSEPSFPGCVIPSKVIGLFRMRDEKGVDDKVLCVPRDDPTGQRRRVALPEGSARGHRGVARAVPKGARVTPTPPESDEELRRRRRRFVTQLAPVALVLIVLGVVFADEDGGLGVVGLAALAQGIGLAVALIGLAFGHNPLSKK